MKELEGDELLAELVSETASANGKKTQLRGERWSDEGNHLWMHHLGDWVVRWLTVPGLVSERGNGWWVGRSMIWQGARGMP